MVAIIAMQPSDTQPENDPSAEATLRPPSSEKTLQWITVLSAKHLDYRLSQDHGRWTLHIPARLSASATAEIEAFEQDEAARLSTPPAPPEQPSRQMIRTAHWTAFWCAYTLVLFYIGLGPFDSTNALHNAGAMSRTELLQGEWWRSITALTLHGGLTHLLANTLFLLFVGQAVMRELGRGLGPTLILAGGILGNYLAAYTAPPYQRSVGASTACFAALGIISTLQAARLYRRYRSWQRVWRQAWIPIAAGIALLGLTGTSPGSDIGAHLFGFLCGAGIVIPAACRPTAIGKLTAAMQWSLAAIAVIVVPVAWMLAYLHTRG